MATNYTFGTTGFGAFPNFGLASQVNPFMSGQAALPYHMNLPGYQGLINQESRNISGLQRGLFPEDAKTMLRQEGAEYGVQMGSPGSPASNAAWLRAMGIGSLGLQKEAAQRLSQFRADTPVPELWNPMSLYVPQLLAQQKLDAAKSGISDAATKPLKEYSSGIRDRFGSMRYDYRYFR